MTGPKYDECYRLLDLEPGAPLADIEAAWKFHASAWHPDKFTGALKDKATRKMQRVNNARDMLREYWQKNGQAPPSGSSATRVPPQTSEHMAEQPQPDYSCTPSDQATVPPPASFTTKPFGPPACNKSWLHRLYNVIATDPNDPYRTSALILFVVVLIGSAYLSYWEMQTGYALAGGFLHRAWTGDSTDEAVFVVLIVFNYFVFFRALAGQADIWEIQDNPYLETKPVPAAKVLDFIGRVIAGQRTDECFWATRAPVRDPDDGAMTIQALVDLNPGMSSRTEATFSITLTVKVLEVSESACTVSYWFELVKAPTLWKVPAAKVMKKMNKALSESLSRLS
jgi:hypothetical protein